MEGGIQSLIWDGSTFIDPVMAVWKSVISSRELVAEPTF